MGAPYLVIGLKPSLLKVLPKPGPWMETFKQLMGFLLLGTVVYLLTLVPLHLVIPTVALLVGLWFACWLAGHFQHRPRGRTRALGWLASLVVSVVSVWICYGWLAPIMHRRVVRDMHLLANLEGGKPSQEVPQGAGEAELPWEPFSLARLDEEIRKGNTVLVDFTADW